MMRDGGVLVAVHDQERRVIFTDIGDWIGLSDLVLVFLDRPADERDSGESAALWIALPLLSACASICNRSVGP